MSKKINVIFLFPLIPNVYIGTFYWGHFIFYFILSQISLVQLLNAFISYNLDVKSESHFLLQCHLFESKRKIHIDEIKKLISIL